MGTFHQDIEAAIPALRRYARALTRDAETADDLVQEVFAILIQTPSDEAWFASSQASQSVVEAKGSCGRSSSAGTRGG